MLLDDTVPAENLILHRVHAFRPVLDLAPAALASSRV